MMDMINGWLRDLSARYGLRGLVVGVLLGLVVLVVVAVLVRWLELDMIGLAELLGWG